MHMSKNITSERLRTACEDLLRSARYAEEVTVRSIAQRAGTSIGAISYHFGSKRSLSYAGRNSSPAPATGHQKTHATEQAALVEQALRDQTDEH